MVRDNKITAVLVSTDLDRAQRFYEDKFGLTLEKEVAELVADGVEFEEI